MMIHILGAVTVLFALHTDYIEASICRDAAVVWRNDNITCPHRAVCADVFDFVRDWRNGTRCEEHRILSNCMCSGGRVCPFNNPDHMLYSSVTHKMFTCERSCNLPWCDNVQRSHSPLSGNSVRPWRSSSTVAQVAVHNANEFGGKTYYQLRCRCQRHMFPVASRRQRAAKAFRYQYDYARRRYSTLFECNSRITDPHHEDPCPRMSL